jgi:hypothetical protein
MYLKSKYVLHGGGSGRGLAPTRGFIVITYDHAIKCVRGGLGLATVLSTTRPGVNAGEGASA